MIYWLTDRRLGPADVWSGGAGDQTQGSNVAVGLPGSSDIQGPRYRYPWCHWLNALCCRVEPREPWQHWTHSWSKCHVLLCLSVLWHLCGALGRRRSKCQSGNVTREMTAAMLSQRFRPSLPKTCQSRATKCFQGRTEIGRCSKTANCQSHKNSFLGWFRLRSQGNNHSPSEIWGHNKVFCLKCLPAFPCALPRADYWKIQSCNCRRINSGLICKTWHVNQYISPICTSLCAPVGTAENHLHQQAPLHTGGMEDTQVTT